MQLILSDSLFEYDIRGILMAFYPWQKFETPEKTGCCSGPEEISASSGSEPVQLLSVLYGERARELHGSDNADILLPCTVFFRDDALSFREEKSLSLDFNNRAEAKTLLKKALYDLLSRANKKSLPWGTLSGIRPTKIAMEGLTEGQTEIDILKHMQQDLLVSENKAKLALSIARREKALLQELDLEQGYSLYVHIPFCPTTCLYCSFTSYPICSYIGKIDQYLDCLFQEIDYIKKNFSNKKLHTIYFGGGTPTSIPAEKLDKLCQKIRDSFDLSYLKEWTVEAGRPDSITREKLEVLLKAGVDRISINPQTMHQKTLDLIGRHHTVQDVLDKYRLARQVGFTNINMDLILGLPGETFADVKETIRQVADLNPENVTIHSLAIKRAARLNQEKDLYSHYQMENTDEAMEYCRQVLSEKELYPYYLYRQKNMAGNLENTGYAKSGKAGYYNVLIMEEVESILAIGAGATTKRVQGSLITRAENIKDVNLYMSSIPEMIDRKIRLFS